MVGTKPPQKGIILANAAKAANSWAENYQHGAEVPDGKKNKTIDIAEDGWPAEDFTFVLRPIDRDVYHGAYLFVYKGSSSLRIHLNAAEIFSEDGATSYGESKNPEDGYDPATNTTRVLVKLAHAARFGLSSVS